MRIILIILWREPPFLFVLVYEKGLKTDDMTKVTSERFDIEDLYFHNDFEEVVVRWDHRTQKAFQKFAGEEEFECNGSSFFNRMVNEGIEITTEQYKNF